MPFQDVATFFEERLAFYTEILDRMKDAALGGNMDALETYSGLEAQTGREIAQARRCFLARRDSPQAEARERRLEELMQEAREASEKTRELLVEEKNITARRLAQIRVSSTPRSFMSAAPALFDRKA